MDVVAPHQLAHQALGHTHVWIIHVREYWVVAQCSPPPFPSKPLLGWHFKMMTSRNTILSLISNLLKKKNTNLLCPLQLIVNLHQVAKNLCFILRFQTIFHIGKILARFLRACGKFLIIVSLLVTRCFMYALIKDHVHYFCYFC